MEDTKVLDSSSLPENQVRVSFFKRPSFYAVLAGKMLESHDTVGTVVSVGPSFSVAVVSSLHHELELTNLASNVFL